jgi:hypothetical protein
LSRGGSDGVPEGAALPGRHLRCCLVRQYDAAFRKRGVAVRASGAPPRGAAWWVGGGEGPRYEPVAVLPRRSIPDLPPLRIRPPRRTGDRGVDRIFAGAGAEALARAVGADGCVAKNYPHRALGATPGGRAAILRGVARLSRRPGRGAWGSRGGPYACEGQVVAVGRVPGGGG